MHLSTLIRTIAFAVAVSLLSIPTSVRADFTDEQCMSCHGDATKVKKVFDKELLADTQHEDAACTECHVGIKKLDHGKDLPKVSCTQGCHEDQVDEYKNSVHALSKEEIPDLVPYCWSCHDTHRILGKKNKKSPVHRNNVAETCGKCHSDKRLTPMFFRRGIEPISDYKRGSHFQAAEKLLKEASEKKPEGAENKGEEKKDGKKSDKKPATCTDCHETHNMLSRGNPTSSINKLNIPKTCGKCHEKERDEYFTSTHWQSLQRGNYDMPVCNDCHGEHSNMKPGERAHGVGASLASSQLCANCHSNRVLMERFGMDASRFDSYLKTYHGMALVRGYEKAPGCTSCHGVHGIRNRDDPESQTYKDNLKKTCGECHKNANDKFVQVAVHPKDQRERNPIAYWVRVAYIWLIIVLIGGMLLHNVIILSHFLRDRWFRAGKPRSERRFSRFQVIQHFLLFVSFSLLALTGFALKFSEAWWVSFLTHVGLDEGARSVVHRCSAVLLVLVSIAQMIYFVVSRAGRREVIALIPSWNDVTECIHNVAYHLRLRSTPPAEEGRFDYTEKAEYLALIWGTGIMTFTGIVLWFPEFFLSFLPIWSFELSEVIHYFEAVLAVGAIFVWHMFFTVFHPKDRPAINSILGPEKKPADGSTPPEHHE